MYIYSLLLVRKYLFHTLLVLILRITEFGPLSEHINR
jgi:hypothetical protein